jgi:hypothetical protein
MSDDLVNPVTPWAQMMRSVVFLFFFSAAQCGFAYNLFSLLSAISEIGRLIFFHLAGLPDNWGGPTLP